MLDTKPRACLLLLPWAADVPSLESIEIRDMHGSGAVSGFAVEASGIERCADAIARWLGVAAA